MTLTPTSKKPMPDDEPADPYPLINPHDPQQSQDELVEPNLLGDIDAMLNGVPGFRTKRHGYSPVEVDNYVLWLQQEFRAARRTAQSLLHSMMQLTEQLEAQRAESAVLASQPLDAKDLAAHWLPQRIQSILQLAVKEADDVRAAALAEVHQLHQAAAAELRDKRECQLNELSARADEAVEERRRMDAEAEARRQRLLAEVESLLESRERAAAERLLIVEQQIASMERTRDELLGNLHMLVSELDAVLLAS
jgi:hypothetical protein